MAEIELKKRAVYAGDVHIALLKSGWSIREACDFVNGLPKANVAEVRHGRWLDVLETDLYVPAHKFTTTRTTETCSECKVRIGFHGAKRYLFDTICPNCGARMGLGGADNGE